MCESGTQRSWLVGCLAFFAGIAPVPSASAGGDRQQGTVYSWRGYNAVSNIEEPGDGKGGGLVTRPFHQSLKNAFPGQNVPFPDYNPDKSRILGMIPGSNVVYTSSHGSYPNDKNFGLRTSASNTDKVTPKDLADLRTQVGEKNMPRMWVLNACYSTGKPDNGPSFPEALGIGKNTPNRIVIGFPESLTGGVGDDFFEKFFENWGQRRPDGTYPTVKEALDQTKDDFKGKNNGIGNMVDYVGDPNLKAPTVLPGLPPEKKPTDGGSGSESSEPTEKPSVPSSSVPGRSSNGGEGPIGGSIAGFGSVRGGGIGGFGGVGGGGFGGTVRGGGCRGDCAGKGGSGCAGNNGGCAGGSGCIGRGGEKSPSGGGCVGKGPSVAKKPTGGGCAGKPANSGGGCLGKPQGTTTAKKPGSVKPGVTKSGAAKPGTATPSGSRIAGAKSMPKQTAGTPATRTAARPQTQSASPKQVSRPATRAAAPRQATRPAAFKSAPRPAQRSMARPASSGRSVKSAPRSSRPMKQAARGAARRR